MLCSGISVMSLFVPFFLSKMTRLPVSTAMPSYCRIRSQRLAPGAEHVYRDPRHNPPTDSMLSSSLQHIVEHLVLSAMLLRDPRTGCKLPPTSVDHALVCSAWPSRYLLYVMSSTTGRPPNTGCRPLLGGRQGHHGAQFLADGLHDTVVTAGAAVPGGAADQGVNAYQAVNIVAASPAHQVDNLLPPCQALEVGDFTLEKGAASWRHRLRREPPSVLLSGRPSSA